MAVTYRLVATCQREDPSGQFWALEGLGKYSGRNRYDKSHVSPSGNRLHCNCGGGYGEE